MENKVGDNLPTAKRLNDILGRLAGAIEDLQQFCVTLEADERARTIKPPRGYEDQVAKVADLCKRYDITSKAAPLDGMLNDLKLAQLLAPYGQQATLIAQLVDDTLLQARSECWSAFLQNYGALGREADHDAALAAELKPVQDWMRAIHGRKSPRAAPPPAPAPQGG